MGAFASLYGVAEARPVKTQPITAQPAVAALAWAKNRPAYNVNAPVYPVIYSDAQKKAQLEAGTAMQQAVNAAAGNPNIRTYTIPPGVYRLPKSGTAFSWSNTHDFTLNMAGVEIILPGGGKIFNLTHTRNISINGPVTFDSDSPTSSQGIIIDYDASTGLMKFKVMPGYQMNLPEKTGFDAYSPQGVYLANGSYAGYSEGKLIDASERIMQVKVEANNPIYSAGNLVAIGLNGSQVLECDDVNGLTMRDLNLYEGGGFLHGGTSGDVKFINLRGSRRPGTNRLYNVTGSQAWNTAGTVTFDGCELGGGADDIMDWMSGGVFTAIKQESPRTLISFDWPLGKNNKVVFYDHTNFNPLGEATIVAATEIQDDALKAEVKKVVEGVQGTSWRDNMTMQRLTLDRDVQVPVGAFIENHSARTGEFIVRNCYFHDCGVRCMVQGFAKGLFENNLFERVSGGLDLTTDAWWHEGTPVQNVMVRGNTFLETTFRNAWGTGKAAINVGPSWTAGSGRRDPNRRYASSNIVIADNTISGSSRAAILVTNRSDVVISGNSITSAFTLADPAGAIQLDTVSNARVEKNTVKNTPGANVALSRVNGALVQNNTFIDASFRLGRSAPKSFGGVISIVDSAKVGIAGNKIVGTDAPHAIWVSDSPDTHIGTNTATKMTAPGATLTGNGDIDRKSANAGMVFPR